MPAAVPAPKRRYPKPFYRPTRDLWYIQIDGRQYSLGRCQSAEEADEKAVELKRRLREAPKPQPPPPAVPLPCPAEAHRPSFPSTQVNGQGSGSWTQKVWRFDSSRPHGA